MNEVRRQENRTAVQAARTDLIVRVVAAADPGLSATAIRAAVEQVAAGMPARGRLADYLAAHPEALTTGASRGPKVVGSFIAALVEAGSQSLVLPCCAECDRQVKLLFPRTRINEPADGTDGGTEGGRSDGVQERICETCWRRGNTAGCVKCGQVRPIAGRTATGGPLCSSCDRWARAQPCSRCDRVVPVAKHDSEGRPVCGACKRLDTSTWKDCVQCQRRRPVCARAEDGSALCSRCYIPPSRTCTRCGQEAPVAAWIEGEPWCMGCYRQPHCKCGGCGRIRRIKIRGRDGQPDLCGSCHRAPVLTCGVCGIEAWMGLARRWGELMPQGAHDPALAAAAGQLRTACRELTHSPNQLTASAAIADRVDLAGVLPVIAHYVDVAVDLAAAARLAIGDPGLLAPASAVARRLGVMPGQVVQPADGWEASEC